MGVKNSFQTCIRLTTTTTLITIHSDYAVIKLHMLLFYVLHVCNIRY